MNESPAEECASPIAIRDEVCHTTSHRPVGPLSFLVDGGRPDSRPELSGGLTNVDSSRHQN